ncbi:TRAP transporter substrate-binding protein DctP [Roseovarius mucosus]|uniref:TRAP transporter substrate-binding protein DctP n=1 Tax=Roseovarius mucosus TaxID=215743 RepID=UPI000AE4FFAF|nr:TRAP transporter substrate-binding protein DctP [Roseovarius mucosus]
MAFLWYRDITIFLFLFAQLTRSLTLPVVHLPKTFERKSLITIACTGMFCSVAAMSSAADLLFAVPDFRDPPTQRFIETIMSDDALAEAGLKLDVLPYSTLGGPVATVQEALKTEAVALLRTELLAFVARNEEKIPTVEMLSAYEKSFFGVAPDADSQGQRAPLELGATALLGDLGLFGLATWPSSPSSIFARRAPTNLADLQGLKLRTTGNASTEFLEQLGAVPQSLLSSEVFQSLETGVIDGTEVLSLPEGDLRQFYEVSSGGALYTDASARTGFFVIGQTGADALTARQLKTLEGAAQKASLAARETLVETYEETLREAEKYGVQVASFSNVLAEQVSVAEQIAQAYGLSQEEILDLIGDIEIAESGDEAPRGESGLSRNGAGRPAHLFVVTPRNDEADHDVRQRFGYKMDASTPLHCFQLNYTREGSRHFGEPFTGEMAISPDGMTTGNGDCIKRVFSQRHPDQGVTFLIHGFNNSFEDAVNWAVSVTEDLAIEGDVVLWSWPSMGQLSGYVRDRDGVDFNRVYLRSFLATLKLFVDQGQTYDISIIAHSMGGLVAMDALRFLAEPPQLSISNVALVAPDVRKAYFQQTLQLGSNISPIWSVYANSNDVALLASYGVNRSPAIGLGGRFRLMMAGVDTVDVSALDRDVCAVWNIGKARCRNHTHAFDVQPVAVDLADLLKSRKPAAARGLIEKQASEGLTYYEIKP